MRLATAALMKLLAAGAVSSLLYLTAALLVARRFAGALSEPLDTAQLALAACGFVAATLSIRLLREGSTAGQAGSAPIRFLIAASPTAAVIAAGISLSLPGTSAAGLAAFWTITLTAEAFHLFRLTLKTGLSRPCPAIVAAKTPDKRITQQLVRSLDADGVDTINGILTAEFLPGQRIAIVHVAFCPPLAAPPTIEVSQTDGPPARVKTVQILPYGARFDIKLAQDAAAPTAVALQFSACVTNKSAD